MYYLIEVEETNGNIQYHVTDDIEIAKRGNIIESDTDEDYILRFKQQLD